MSQQNTRDEKASSDAWKALEILDAPVRSGPFDRVEGIDSIHLGLDAMASALARLFDLPRVEHDDAPKIDEVLDYLRSKDKIDDEPVKLAMKVIDRIKAATYRGLTKEGIESAEKDRSELHARLKSLLQEDVDHGNASDD